MTPGSAAWRSVAQRSEEARLALECTGEMRVQDERLLDCDATAEPLVGRLEDGSHTALPENPDDSVSTLQKRIGFEHGRYFQGREWRVERPDSTPTTSTLPRASRVAQVLAAIRREWTGVSVAPRCLRRSADCSTRLC